MKKSQFSMLPAALPLVCLLAFLFSCNTPSASVAGLSVDSLKLADQKMLAYIDDGKLPCISTLVIRDGHTVHQRTHGLANLEEERALEEETIFRIYSMSKPITAAALMILFDEGKFQLDDPVASHIPSFENTGVYVDHELVEQKEAFTVRHLLTHTAGFCYGWDPDSHVDSLYNKATPTGIWGCATLAELVELLARIPLKNQPGTTYEYSVSIDVAGYLVEVLSGMPFDEFLQIRIFDPLGMDDTGFEVPEEDVGRLAMIYTPDEEAGALTPVETMTHEVKQKVTLFSGGGGLVSTIGDYGRFGQMLLNGGEFEGVRVLNESTVKLIMSDQLPSAVTFAEGIGYGLGGSVVKETGAYSWSGMASTSFVADPENQMVVLAFSQYVPFMGIPFAEEYKSMVLNAVMD